MSHHDKDLGSWSQLESEQTVIFLSPRDSDKFDRPNEASEMTYRHMAEDLELLRQHPGLDELDIIAGASEATIGLAYAMNYPDRAGKLILIRSNLLGCHGADLSFLAEMRRVQTEMQTNTDEELKAFMFAILPKIFADPENMPTMEAKRTYKLK